MAQFGYLRLYFDIDIASRRLLRWIARIIAGAIIVRTFRSQKILK